MPSRDLERQWDALMNTIGDAVGDQPLTVDNFSEEDGVVYRAHPGADPEQGIVVGKNKTYVFVRYGSDSFAKATLPTMLEHLRRKP